MIPSMAHPRKPDCGHVRKFAGPWAQSVLDPVMIRCSIVLFKDNAFLGTSPHESVLLAGSLPLLVVGRALF